MVLSIFKPLFKMEKAPCWFSVNLFPFVDPSLIVHSLSEVGLAPLSYR